MKKKWNELTRKQKIRKVLKYTMYVAAIGILIFDTYRTHFAPKNTTKPTNLNVYYENGGNILLLDIKDGSSTSLSINVKNKTDHVIYYQLKFSDVVNELSYNKSATYTLSKEDGTVEIDSEVFPTDNIQMKSGDQINPGEEIDYSLTVRIGHLEDEDIKKNIEAHVKFVEVEGNDNNGV